MTSLHLTSKETYDLAHIQSTLLTPQSGPLTEHYLLQCNIAMQNFLGADICTYSFPKNKGLHHVIRDISAEQLSTYHTFLKSIEKRFQVLEAHVALGIWNRPQAFGVSYHAYKQTTYYNEFVKPIRGFNATGITLSTPDLLYVTHSFTNTAPITHAQENRRLALLQLLYPAFKSGALNYYYTTHALTNNARLLDNLPLNAFLFTLAGQPLHRSTALQTLLHNNSDASLITTHAQRMPASLSALLRQKTPLLDTHTTHRLRTASNHYELTASLVPAGVLARPPCVIVLIRQANVTKPDSHQMQEQWALTPREAEVALLVCERLSNREISERLDISTHTVRHHVESILTKLGLTSRKNILSTLLATT